MVGQISALDARETESSSERLQLMRSTGHFLIAFVIAAVSASLGAGIFFWSWALLNQTVATTPFPSFRDLGLFAAFSFFGASVAMVPALLTVGALLWIGNKNSFLLFISAGVVTGVCGSIILLLGNPDFNPAAEDAQVFFYSSPILATFALAGAVGGWTFARVWLTAR